MGGGGGGGGGGKGKESQTPKNTENMRSELHNQTLNEMFVQRTD